MWGHTILLRIMTRRSHMNVLLSRLDRIRNSNLILSHVTQKRRGNLLQRHKAIGRHLSTRYCYASILWDLHSLNHPILLHPLLVDNIGCVHHLPYVKNVLSVFSWVLIKHCINVFCHLFAIIIFQNPLDTRFFTPICQC